ncbi:MAG TPA: T9SS type A sorting domain-containing protein [Ignavibacteria bacterium]|nr:T9SS type A sorting domain-containing protein [Ignavibacteria bacterium]
MNFPNPFNPSTSITFEIERSSFVTLEAFNVSGKMIVVLINDETILSGKKEITFDGSGLSSGIYFYKLTAGDFTQTRRML